MNIIIENKNSQQELETENIVPMSHDNENLTRKQQSSMVVTAQSDEPDEPWETESDVRMKSSPHDVTQMSSEPGKDYLKEVLATEQETMKGRRGIVQLASPRRKANGIRSRESGINEFDQEGVTKMKPVEDVHLDDLPVTSITATESNSDGHVDTVISRDREAMMRGHRGIMQVASPRKRSGHKIEAEEEDLAKGRRGVIQLASPRRKAMPFKGREEEVMNSGQHIDTANEVNSVSDQHLGQEEAPRMGSFFPHTVDLHEATATPIEISSDNQVDTVFPQDEAMMKGHRGIMQVAPPLKRHAHQNEVEEEYLAKGRRGVKQLASPRRKVMSLNDREEEEVSSDHYDNVMCARTLPEANIVPANTSLDENELHDIAEPPMLFNRDIMMKGRRGVEQVAFPRKKNLDWHTPEDDVAHNDMADEIISAPDQHLDQEEASRTGSFFPSTVHLHEATATPTETSSDDQMDNAISQDEAMMRGHRGIMQVASPRKRYGHQSEVEEEDLAKGPRGVKQLASPHRKAMSFKGRESEVMSSEQPKNIANKVNSVPVQHLDQEEASRTGSFFPRTVDLYEAMVTPTKSGSSDQVDNAISQDEALMKGHRGIMQVASPRKRYGHQSEAEEEDLAKGRRGVKQLASPHKKAMSLKDREVEVMSLEQPKDIANKVNSVPVQHLDQEEASRTGSFFPRTVDLYEATATPTKSGSSDQVGNAISQDEALMKGHRGIMQVASPRKRYGHQSEAEEEDLAKGRRGVKQLASPHKKAMSSKDREVEVMSSEQPKDIANEANSVPVQHLDQEEASVDLYEATMTPTKSGSSDQVDNAISQDEAMMRGHRGIIQVASPRKRYGHQSEAEEEDLAKGRRGVKQLASPHKKAMSLKDREVEVMSSEQPKDIANEVNSVPVQHLYQEEASVDLYEATTTPTQSGSSDQVGNAISQDEALMKGHRGIMQVASPRKRYGHQSEAEEEDLAKDRRDVKQLAPPHKKAMSSKDREGEVMSSEQPKVIANKVNNVPAQHLYQEEAPRTRSFFPLEATAPPTEINSDDQVDNAIPQDEALMKGHRGVMQVASPLKRHTYQSETEEDLAKGSRYVNQLASPRGKAISLKDREGEVMSSEQHKDIAHVRTLPEANFVSTNTSRDANVTHNDTANEIINVPVQHLDQEEAPRTESFFPHTVDLHKASVTPTESGSSDQVDNSIPHDETLMKGHRGVMRVASPLKRHAHQSETEEDLAKGRQCVNQLASPRGKAMPLKDREGEVMSSEQPKDIANEVNSVPVQHLDQEEAPRTESSPLEATTAPTEISSDDQMDNAISQDEALMKGHRGIMQVASPRKRYGHQSEAEEEDLSKGRRGVKQLASPHKKAMSLKDREVEVMSSEQPKDIANKVNSVPVQHLDQEEAFVDLYEATMTPTKSGSSDQVDNAISQDEALMKGHRGIIQVASPRKRYGYQSETEEEDLAKGRRGVKQLASPHKKAMSLKDREIEVMSSEQPKDIANEANSVPDQHSDQEEAPRTRSFFPRTVDLYEATATPTKSGSSDQVDNAISQDEALMKGHRGIIQVASPRKRYGYQSETEEEDLAKGRRGVKQLASPHKKAMSLKDREVEVMSSEQPKDIANEANSVPDQHSDQEEAPRTRSFFPHTVDLHEATVTPTEISSGEQVDTVIPQDEAMVKGHRGVMQVESPLKGSTYHSEVGEEDSAKGRRRVLDLASSYGKVMSSKGRVGEEVSLEHHDDVVQAKTLPEAAIVSTSTSRAADVIHNVAVSPPVLNSNVVPKCNEGFEQVASPRKKNLDWHAPEEDQRLKGRHDIEQLSSPRRKGITHKGRANGINIQPGPHLEQVEDTDMGPFSSPGPNIEKRMNIVEDDNSVLVDKPSYKDTNLNSYDGRFDSNTRNVVKEEVSKRGDGGIVPDAAPRRRVTTINRGGVFNDPPIDNVKDDEVMSKGSVSTMAAPDVSPESKLGNDVTQLNHQNMGISNGVSSNVNNGSSALTGGDAFVMGMNKFGSGGHTREVVAPRKTFVSHPFDDAESLKPLGSDEVKSSSTIPHSMDEESLESNYSPRMIEVEGVVDKSGKVSKEDVVAAQANISSDDGKHKVFNRFGCDEDSEYNSSTVSPILEEANVPPSSSNTVNVAVNNKSENAGNITVGPTGTDGLLSTPGSSPHNKEVTDDAAVGVTTIEPSSEIKEGGGVMTSSIDNMWKKRFFDSRDSDEGIRTNHPNLQSGGKIKKEKEKSSDKEEGLSSIPDLCEVCRKYYLAIPRP